MDEQPQAKQPQAEQPRPVNLPRGRRVRRGFFKRPPQPGEVVQLRTATYRVGPKGNWIRQS